MNKKCISSRFVSAAGISLAALLFFVGSAPSLFAVLGVADTVFISGDATDLYKWPRELAQWEKVCGVLQLQLKQQELLVSRMGQASFSGAKAAGAVGPVTDAVSAMLAIEQRERTLEEGRETAAAGKRGLDTLRSSSKVSATFQVLGASHQRDKTLYRHLGALDAMRERQEGAIQSMETVAQRELERQKGLLAQLKTANTQLDIQAIQAALAASSQRLELARMKADQTRDEYALVASRLKDEDQRKQEADHELSSKMVECLQARALTSLQAQKDQAL